MKSTLTKLMACLLVTSFVAGCSTNTQKENTLVGAGTGAVAGGLLGSLAHGAGAGWVVAGGAIVGAVIGGLIGHNMDSSDNHQVSTALNTYPANQPMKWENKKSKVKFRFTPTSPMMTYNGNPNCRKYDAVVYSNGKVIKSDGIACKQPNGKWASVKSM